MGEKNQTKTRKQFPWQNEHNLPWTRTQCPSKLPSTYHIISISYIMSVGL